ncbi:IclR family transcriptional regulator [Kibdelosporangium phytohabitans]|uniref:IclR family transcriptional regulator n=1 Tax=Kibdelosporangium phytohabitans TaxID=860235 RepID=UPI0009F82F8C|nr:helix-turn-helix domain-containing protein [Kibdelosporangium phytohabitans]
MGSGSKSGQHGRRVLEGAFLVLEEVARAGEAGLTQLAATTGLPKATVHRLLLQLAELGAVRREAGRYRVGARVFRLGQAWDPVPALRAASRQPLRQLAAVTGQASVGLSVQEAERSTLISCRRGELDEILPWRVGTLLPHGCAVDIVSATCTPGVPPPDGYSAAAWKRVVSRAFDQGMAFDYTKSGPWGACCMGAPIHAPSGRVVAALALAVLDERRLAALAPAVRRFAGMITANLARLPSCHG